MKALPQKKMPRISVATALHASATGAALMRGFEPRAIWTSGVRRLVRVGSSHGLRVAPRAQALHAKSAVSSAALAAAPRPAPPPILERAGDLTGRLLGDYLSGWTSQYTEYDYYIPPEAIHGTVPEDIRGTLFLIGPALTEAYGTSVRHPSDGDGMVCSLAFGDGGQIFFRNRYVRTTTFVAEQAVGRRVSRGLHDRGAPIVVGQQSNHHHHHHQQQQRHQQAHSRNAQQSNRYSQQQRQQQRSPPAAPSAEAQHEAARAAFDNDDGGWSGWSGAAGGDGPMRGPSVSSAAIATAATAAAAAAGAVQKTFRLDPFALLGLPSPPPLSALFNPLDLAFRAPANAAVVHWAGRLLAFSEGGSLPYELNKLSLETVGVYDMAGAMADIGRLVGAYKIAPEPAPPAEDADGGGGGGSSSRPHRLVVMGAAQSGPDALLRWVEVGEDGRPAGRPTTYRMPGAAAQGLKDFWVTDRFYVVVQSPLDFNPQRFATQATLGAASFAECFDWDEGRPARIHLVPRPAPPPPSSNPSSSSSTSLKPPGKGSPVAAAVSSAAASASASGPGAAATGRSGSTGRPERGGVRANIGSSAPVVWPPKGPEAIVVDAPPLLPVFATGCYSPDPHGQLLVLDAICQQGMPGTGGGTLDSLELEDHRLQPKPELTRITVDLTAGSATARVLSQRTAAAATTAAAFVAGGSGGSATAAAAPCVAPVGHGGSFAGGYHHLYVAASANDAATEGWAPSQVLLKLSVPPPHAAAASATAKAAAAERADDGSRLVRRRGVGAEVWCPGERVFVGPPVFVPRMRPAGSSGDAAATAEVLVAGGGGGGGSPLLPLESEVAAAAQRVAATVAARRREDERDGWLLVLVHDAESMTADLCVLDACEVTHGPVAVISLPHHLPHVRGAHFTRSYCGPGLAAPPGWRPRAAADITAAAAKPTSGTPPADLK